MWHDIRLNPEKLTSLLKEYDIEYVFNYAAEPYIPKCYEEPEHFFEINASAVLKVMEACQKANIKKILQVSSAEIYGDMKGQIKESDRVVPHSTYGVSKVAADGLVQVRFREAGTPAIAMRQFNCYGERETHSYVIPEIISQLAEGPSVKLGNNIKRDFQYAGDAVRMAVELLEKGECGEVYNMGSENVIEIYELARVIGKLMGYEQIEIIEDPSRKRKWEIWHLQSDNTKLYSVIGYRHATTFEEGLQKTIEYFFQNGKKWDFDMELLKKKKW
jgi:nucleoside-diphosphate-sugar epimerase